MAQTIELSLSEELLRLVDERAQRAGVPREEYIRAVLLDVVGARPSISAILAPFREQVASSGVSNEELDRLFSQARDEFFRDRTTSRSDKR